jgi:hypothetical protein
MSRAPIPSTASTPGHGQSEDLGAPPTELQPNQADGGARFVRDPGPRLGSRDLSQGVARGLPPYSLIVV